jgi:hypothetical protein
MPCSGVRHEVIAMWKKTRVMFLAAALSSGSALAADAGSLAQQRQQEDSRYDEARMRPRDTAAQGKSSGRSVQYDESKMEPGEVTGAGQDASREPRDSVEYDESRMKPVQN